MTTDLLTTASTRSEPELDLKADSMVIMDAGQREALLVALASCLAIGRGDTAAALQVARDRLRPTELVEQLQRLADAVAAAERPGAAHAPQPLEAGAAAQHTIVALGRAYQRAKQAAEAHDWACSALSGTPPDAAPGPGEALWEVADEAELALFDALEDLDAPITGTPDEAGTPSKRSSARSKKGVTRP